MLQLKEKDQSILNRAMALFWKKENEASYPLLSLILRLPQDFKSLRSIKHLSRLLARVYFQKLLLEDEVEKNLPRRTILVKSLSLEIHSPFGSKQVMGVLLTFNSLNRNEVFREPHFVQSLQRIVPSLKPQEGSFIDFSDPNDSLRVVYMECDPLEGANLKLFKKQLIEELLSSIEILVPVTFRQRNEEEIYRHLVLLKDQLRSVKDVPQVMIEFEGQTASKLEFTVLVARLIKKNSQPITKLLHEKNFSWTIDKEEVVGKLRDRHLKEALIFKVELPKKLFFRKDHSLNLFKARQHLANEATALFGSIRDFNGGLIDKQQEHFQNFKALLPSFFDEFLLENFFFSISPIFMQGILPPALVKDWFLTLYNASEKEHDLIEIDQISGGKVVYVKIENELESEKLLKKIKAFLTPEKEVAFARIYLGSSWTLSFFCIQKPGVTYCDIIQALEEGIEEYHQRKSAHSCLRLAFIEREPILDPRLSKEDQSYLIIKMLYEGLTRLKPDGTIELAIAQSVEISKDFRSFIFHLRPCKWSNGEAITAYDFEYSWKMALSPKVHSIFSHPLFIIDLAKEASLGLVPTHRVGIYAIDPHTLKVILHSPCPNFLERTSHWTYFLINSQIDRKNPGWALRAGQSYVCNGPFKLDQWHSSRFMSLVKNPDYWDADSVGLDKIHLQLGQSASKAWELFDKKEIDFFGRPIHPVSPEFFDFLPSHALKKTSRLKGVYLIWLNTKRLPFANLKLRKAFKLALTLGQFPALLPSECSNSATSILPASFSQVIKSEEDALQEAKRLFKEGMEETSLTPKELKKLIICHTSGMSREILFSEMCSAWNKAFDLELHFESSEWRRHFDKLAKGDFDIGGMELHAWWNDPLHLLEYFKHREDPFNFSKWENKEYIQTLDNAVLLQDGEERKNCLKKAEEILASEVPAIPLYEMQGTYLISNKLEGEFVSEFFEIDFKWTRLKKEGSI